MVFALLVGLLSLLSPCGINSFQQQKPGNELVVDFGPKFKLSGINNEIQNLSLFSKSLPPTVTFTRADEKVFCLCLDKNN